ISGLPKQSAPAARESARVNPIVLIFMSQFLAMKRGKERRKRIANGRLPAPARSSLSSRHPVGFDQSDAGGVVFAANDRRIITRGWEGSDGRFAIVDRVELGGCHGFGLSHFPVVVGGQKLAVGIV